MEVIPNDPYFEFRPNTLEDVRREFNLDKPGEIEGVIKNFEEWIQKQAHFTKKDFTKHFLEVSIILSKGSLEKAKKSLDKLCTMRTLIPQFFSKYNVRKEMVDLSSYLVAVLMPKLTEDHYRIFFLNFTSTDIDTLTWYDYYRYIMLMCEYMKAHDYTQGMCCVVDVRNVNVMSLAMKFNVLDMRDLFVTMLEGYGMRIKAIHYISDSKAIEALIAVMKQILSEKISGRVYVHKTLESVYSHIDRDLLPGDYGGKEKPYLELYGDYLDVLSREENVEYFKDICASGTNEAYRQTATYNNDILGMPGSFRSLTVD